MAQHRSIVVGEHEIDVVDATATGAELKQRAGLPRDRVLVRREGARNVIIPDSWRVRVADGDVFRHHAGHAKGDRRSARPDCRDPRASPAPARCRVLVPRALWTALLAHVGQAHVERLAYLLAGTSWWEDMRGRATVELLARRLLLPSDDAYVAQGPTRVWTDPAVSRQVLRACYEGGLSLVDVHAHPDALTSVAFSRQDLRDSLRAHAEFAAVMPKQPPAVAASLVLGGGCVAGVWRDPQGGTLDALDQLWVLDAQRERLRLSWPHSSIGDSRRCNTSPAGVPRAVHARGRPQRSTSDASPATDRRQREDRHDRQVRAFGHEAQERLGQLHVGVVGGGGVGSLLVEGLARLGVRRLTLVDPDQVSDSNLNRLVGATEQDARTSASKVSVLAREARRVDAGVDVRAVRGDVAHPGVWSQLRAADVLLGAVDSHAGRWAMNVLAVQYARHYIDVGVEVTASPQTGAAGHVAVVRPDGPCLRCLQGYDPRSAADELQPALRTAKAAAGYVADAPELPTPSVVFLNQVAAGHALAAVLDVVAAWRAPADYVLFDLALGESSPMDGIADPACPVCGDEGIRGAGDAAGVPLSAGTAPAGTPGATTRSTLGDRT